MRYSPFGISSDMFCFSGELSESKEVSSILDISSQKLEKPKQTLSGPENGSPIKAPVPKVRKMLYKAQDLKQDDNQPFPRQRTDSLNARGAPKGILKRNSSSSSTDSETVRFHQNFEPKSKIVSPGLTIHERISEKEHSLEDDNSSNSLEPLKHVRFSAVKDELPQSPGLVHGREVGEFSVLESDRLKNGTEGAGLKDEVGNDPWPFQYTNSLPFQSSASSPSPSKNETSQPTTSGSFPINEHSSPKEVLTTRALSTENSHTINEHKTSSSELSKNPAGKRFITTRLRNWPSGLGMARTARQPGRSPFCLLGVPAEIQAEATGECLCLFMGLQVVLNHQ